MIRDVLRLPVNRPWLILILTMGCVIVASLGCGNLYFRGDYQTFFDQDNPQLVAFKKMEAAFSKTDTLTIVVAPENGNIFTVENITLLQKLTDDAWQIPYASRVDSLTNYQHTTADGDDLLVEDLAPDYYPVDEERLDYIRDVALNAPRLTGSIVSKDGSVGIVNITFQLPDGDQTVQVNEISRFASNLLAEASNAYPNVSFHVAGIIGMNHAFSAAAMADGSTLLPIMFVVILVFIGLMLRSWKYVVATLLVIFLSISATMGLLGWVGHYISNTTVNVPTIILTLAVADSVHLITSYMQSLKEGKGKNEALEHALRINILALFITSATTAVGFLMMNASDSPVMHDMGNLAAVGVMIAFILSVTLLPALLRLIPVNLKPADEARDTTMARFSDLVIRHHRLVLPISVLVIAFSALLALQNEVNDNSVEYFGHDNAFRQAADFMEERLSGTTTISVVIDSGEPQGITQPEFLRAVDGFATWLRLQPEVDHVATISDTFKRLNKNMHGDDDAYYTLPTAAELAAQYLLLYEMSLPYGLDLNNEVNIDKSAVKILVTTDNLGSKQLVALETRLNRWFHSNEPDYVVVTSGPNLMFAHIGEENMASMLKTLPFALILISLLLAFALKSWRLGVISLVPNLVPAILGFGVWSLVSGQINLGLSVVITLTLGIVVDDTVHFLTKYRYARLQGKDAEEGIRYAFNTVGRALWVTTIVLMAGFSVLATSDFRVNGDMGMLSALVIFIALVVDFIMLPALLLVADRKAYREVQGACELQPS